MKYLIALLLLAMIGCTSSHQNMSLQQGDLLFQDLNCGDLCDAIEAVTEGVDGKDFSHCGMVVMIDDTLKVVEAIGSKVQINSLANFFARSGDTSTIQNITIARVKTAYEPLIDQASEFAKQQIGQPYDDEFLMSNGKWYCSELLYEAFKEANDQQDFFELNPMTFKDPETQSFFPAWINYYQELGVEIPEGEPGLNPGSISRSDKIQVVEMNTLSYNQHEQKKEH